MPSEDITVSQLREELRKFIADHGISHLELSKQGIRKFGKGQGFSPAAISNLIGNANQSARQFTRPSAKRRLIQLKELAEKIAEGEETQSSVVTLDLDSKVRRLFNQTWYVYYFKPGHELDIEANIIGRGILSVGSTTDSVFLKNDSAPSESNFSGSFGMYNDNYAHCFLKTEHTKEGSLFANIFFGREKIYPISMGIYTNVNRNFTSFISGSLILEHIPDPDQTKIGDPKLYIPGKSNFDEIPPPIREFFAEYKNNFIEIPHSILTLGKLAKYNKNSESY